MLPHGRRDCDTFCDYQRYRVDCDSNGAWVQARGRILVYGCGIEVVLMARHCDVLRMLVCITRQRRGVRDVYVGCGGGDIATCPVQKAQRETRIVLARLLARLKDVYGSRNCGCLN